MMCPHNCPAGTCKEFGFTDRRADICAGRVLTPEKCEAYRSNWQRMKEFGKQAVSFVGATAAWIAAGMPRRTPGEISRLYLICLSCEHIRPAGENAATCGLCNCHLTRDATIIGKLEMKTERCPDGRWT